MLSFLKIRTIVTNLYKNGEKMIVPTIQVFGVSKTYKRVKTSEGISNAIKSLFFREYDYVQSLTNINFSVQQGESVALIGQNGAGKSTLLKILSGIIQPTKGSALVLGASPSYRNYALKKRISIVLGKKNQLWWDLPVIESLLLNKDLYGIPKKDFDDKVSELGNMLNISHLLEVPVRTLSTGERMKCELLMSLLHTPEVLFLDEPTIGLDLPSQIAIRNVLCDYVKKNNATLILVSHYLPDIEELCSRVIILKKGTVAFDGDLKGLISTEEKYRSISIEFSNTEDAETVRANLNGIFGQSKYLVTVKLPRSQINKQLVHIIENHNIVDLHIEEPKLEDSLKVVFNE